MTGSRCNQGALARLRLALFISDSCQLPRVHPAAIEHRSRRSARVSLARCRSVLDNVAQMSFGCLSSLQVSKCIHYVFAEIGIDMRGVLQLISRLEPAETFAVVSHRGISWRKIITRATDAAYAQHADHALPPGTHGEGTRVSISLLVMISPRLHTV